MSRRWSRVISLLAATAFAVVAAFGYAVAEAGSPSIEVRDAWVLRAPPVVKMHAGYLTLRNTGAESRALVAVSSPSYGHVEVHLAQTVDGVATMQSVAQVALPPGERVQFQPGGLHLMLMMPQGLSAEAAAVMLRLSFDDGSVVEAEAVFRNGAPSPGSHADHRMDAGS